MPIYERLCQRCGAVFEVLSPAEHRDDDPGCLHCDGDTKRLPSVPGQATGDFGTPPRAR